MSVIADLDDVKRILRAIPPQGIAKIKIGDSNTDHMTTDDAQAFLDAQESYFIARIQFTPASPYEAIITEVVAKLSAYAIYISMMTLSGSGEIPPHVQYWSDWSEKQIMNILNGKLRIQASVSTGTSNVEAPRSSDVCQLVNEYIRLDGTDYEKLCHSRILAGSEIIASTKTKTVVYVRDTDYNISYETGEVRRTTSSSITDGQTVYAFYSYIREKNQPVDKTRGSIEYSPNDGTY